MAEGRMILRVTEAVAFLATLESDSIDAIVTDPPYGLEFMGQEWDRLRSDEAPAIDRRQPGDATFRRGTGPFGRAKVRFATGASYGGNTGADQQRWHEAWAREAHRILKPGGHLLAFGGTRTYHRMTCAIEDAGFEIRDSLHWMYGTGFPKSLNVGDGRGTALKPGHEPIVLARKPLDGTVAANVAKWGTGALNIDATRIEGRERTEYGLKTARRSKGVAYGEPSESADFDASKGRWPANVLLDEDAAAELDAQSGTLQGRGNKGASTAKSTDSVAMGRMTERPSGAEYNYDAGGGASRFFYVAKPGKKERNAGCEGLLWQRLPDGSLRAVTEAEWKALDPKNRTRGNVHPTVKPVALMRYLIRLVTPLDGTVIDPFVGSGTTAVAAKLEKRRFIGVDKNKSYIQIAKSRVRGTHG